MHAYNEALGQVDTTSFLIMFELCAKMCNFKFMPLRSRGQSTVYAWREFELTNKSTEWNLFFEVSNSRRRRTWFTHVRAAVWSNIIQVFYNKKWSCDHL